MTNDDSVDELVVSDLFQRSTELEMKGQTKVTEIFTDSVQFERGTDGTSVSSSNGPTSDERERERGRAGQGKKVNFRLLGWRNNKSVPLLLLALLLNGSKIDKKLPFSGFCPG
jgi:hypothetical protein